MRFRSLASLLYCCLAFGPICRSSKVRNVTLQFLYHHCIARRVIYVEANKVSTGYTVRNKKDVGAESCSLPAVLCPETKYDIQPRPRKQPDHKV